MLDALSTEFHVGLPWELLYADDLALIAESRAELLEKIKSWKEGMEAKGLRVNMGKTKVMRCESKGFRRRTQANGHVVYVEKVLGETQSGV